MVGQLELKLLRKHDVVRFEIKVGLIWIALLKRCHDFLRFMWNFSLFSLVATDVGDSSGRRRDVPIHDSPKNHCNNSASTEVLFVDEQFLN